MNEFIYFFPAVYVSGSMYYRTCINECKLLIEILNKITSQFPNLLVISNST